MESATDSGPPLVFNSSDNVTVVDSSTSALNVSTSFALALKCLDFFNFYYLAVIIIFGVVGNTLNFLVFTRTHLKLRSSSYYLAALALADLGFLLTLLVVWLNHVGVDLFNRQGFCQALVYTSSVCSCLSVWLTVAFTIERLIAVQYPLQRPYMCTVRRAKIIISVLSFTTLSGHIYSLFTAGITDGPEGKSICDLLPAYYRFMHVVNLLDTILTLVIPFILIVVMNTLIAKNLIVFSRTFNRKKSRSNNSSAQHIQMKTIRMTEHWQERDSGQGSVSNPSHHSNNNSNGNLHAQQLANSVPVEAASTSVSSPGHLERSTANAAVAGGCASVNKVTVNQVAIHQQAAHEASHDSQICTQEKLQYRNILSIRIQYSITKMLLLISTVFIMLNLPSYVVRLQVFISEVSGSNSEVSSTAWLLQQFFMLLYYTNFSINFLLYSTCGTTFRHCLCRLIRDKRDAMRRSIIGIRYRYTGSNHPPYP
ncbi:thyrotropin-releasing hormone receptor [Daphnia magna]|nr:thyrotropin-releasing hormone receptor [Daphnia magna]KZS12306.1 putative CNMamide receptor [Daphnia magna]